MRLAEESDEALGRIDLRIVGDRLEIGCANLGCRRLFGKSRHPVAFYAMLGMRPLTDRGSPACDELATPPRVQPAIKVIAKWIRMSSAPFQDNALIEDLFAGEVFIQLLKAFQDFMAHSIIADVGYDDRVFGYQCSHLKQAPICRVRALIGYSPSLSLTGIRC